MSYFLLPIIFVIFIVFVLLPFLENKNNRSRTFVSIVMAIIVIRYLYWRLFYTVLNIDFDFISTCWVWFCFIIELIAWIESLLFFLLMSKTIDRKNKANEYEKILRNAHEESLPNVDVYIPTYDEGIDVLEKTIICSLNLYWPKSKLKVWILDDGKRDWLKEYCHNKNIGYITRENNHGAKAGNINNALKITEGDLILFLDADFAVYGEFLYQTVGFFEKKDVAIVQTPQTFFNKDFVQVNLGLHEIIPDDQRLFFETIMPSRDYWGVAFFCGSCAIAKRRTLLSIGKLSYESLTEDILLSMKLLHKGYKTIYLNKKLSHGLAAESIEAFSTQRQRWCHGGIQLLFSKDGPLSPDFPLLVRLFFIPLHWIIHTIMRISFLVVPIIFLLTGVPPMMVGDPYEVTYYQLPLFIYSYGGMLWFAPWQFIPIVTNAYENITAFNLLPTVINALINPFGKTFKVTPKGDKNKGSYYHKYSLYTSLSLFLLTLFGIAINLHPEYKIVHNVSFFPIAIAWCIMNLVILALMILMSVEKKRQRKEERFPVKKNANIIINNKKIQVIVKDISMSGAYIESKNPLPEIDEDKVIILIKDDFFINSDIVYKSNLSLRINFNNISDEQREKLILYIYSGDFSNDKASKSFKKFFLQLFNRSFGK